MQSRTIVLAALVVGCSSTEPMVDDGDRRDEVAGQPWRELCAGVEDECAADRPWFCEREDEPPVYDCGKCGCPGAEVCHEDVCYDPAVLALQRFSTSIPSNLPASDYLALFSELMALPAVTYDQMVDDIAAEMTQDQRRAALLLGESHGSDDEQAVGVQLVADLAQAGFAPTEIDIEGTIIDAKKFSGLGVTAKGFASDLTNGPHCKAAVDGVDGDLNTDGLYVMYSGSAHLSREACFHGQLYPICQTPHVAECLLADGRLAVTVVMLDPARWIGRYDQILSQRLPAFASPAFDAQIDGDLAQWNAWLATQVVQAKFQTQVLGRSVNARVVASPRVSGLRFVILPRPAAQPVFLRSLRSMTQLAPLRSLLVAQSATPGSCSLSTGIGPDGTIVDLGVSCSGSGGTVRASIDPATFAVLEFELDS